MRMIGRQKPQSPLSGPGQRSFRCESETQAALVRPACPGDVTHVSLGLSTYEGIADARMGHRTACLNETLSINS